MRRRERDDACSEKATCCFVSCGPIPASSAFVAEFDGKCTCVVHRHSTSCSRIAEARFLGSLTTSLHHRTCDAAILSTARKGRRVSGSTIDLHSSTVPLPPLPEQQRITAYLDASCAAIDAAVAAKRRQIETLDALRKSIIHGPSHGALMSPQAEASGNDWLGEVPSTGMETRCLKRDIR